MIYHCVAHTVSCWSGMRNDHKETFMVEAENSLDAKDCIKEHYKKENATCMPQDFRELKFIDVAISLKVEY